MKVSFYKNIKNNNEEVINLVFSIVILVLHFDHSV